MASKKHLAGIVPVSGLKSDFDLPWHPSLMPLAPDYLAVERAVAECAYAGCNTIWIVCDDSITPLIRHQIGEKIQDPVYSYRHFEINKNDAQRPIRIYYVPVAIRDINKRDNLAWSAIYGTKTAHKILKKISDWTAPDKFYISWPYGYYKPFLIRSLRRNISENNFMLRFNDKTVKDNLYLGFTLTMKQVDLLLSEVRAKSSGVWQDDNHTKRLPMEERFSYRNFDLKEVFNSINIGSYNIYDVEDYSTIDCWKKYCKFLGENEAPSKPALLRYSEWNEIGVDEENDS